MISAVSFCSFVVVVEFRRISSSFDAFLVSFVEFCSYWSLRNLFLSGILGPAAFFWQFRCFASGWLGGRCEGLFGALISVCFWLRRRPSTLFWLFSLRVVLPLELEIFVL